MSCVPSRGTQSLAQCHNQQTISELKTNKKAAWKKLTREGETEVLKSIVDKELLTATLVNISKYRSDVLWVTKTPVNTPAESQIHHSLSPAKTKQCSYNVPFVIPCRLGFSCRAKWLGLTEYSNRKGKATWPCPTVQFSMEYRE